MRLAVHSLGNITVFRALVIPLPFHITLSFLSQCFLSISSYSLHLLYMYNTNYKHWKVCCYPEEAVGGFLGSQAALHTRRELFHPANCVVIIIITCFLSDHDNMKWNTHLNQRHTCEVDNIQCTFLEQMGSNVPHSKKKKNYSNV